MGTLGASSGKMPWLPRPRPRPEPELGGSLLDALLDGQSLPPDAPEELRAVAEILTDMAGPAEPGDLDGEAAARAALVRSASPAGPRHAVRRSSRRRSRRP